MICVVRVRVQNEMDECLIRCVATPSEQDTNSGKTYKPRACLSVRLSVGFSFVFIVVLPGVDYPRLCWIWHDGVGVDLQPECLTLLHQLSHSRCCGSRPNAT